MSQHKIEAQSMLANSRFDNTPSGVQNIVITDDEYNEEICVKGHSNYVNWDEIE